MKRKLELKCKCGDTFVLATSVNKGSWDEYRAWDASLARFMEDHDNCGGLEFDNVYY